MWDKIAQGAALVVSILLVIGMVTEGGTDILQANAQVYANNLTSINNKMWDRYSNQPGKYTAAVITDETLISQKIIPEGMQLNATTITNPWGGDVTVTGRTSGLEFTVDTDDVDSTACVDFVTKKVKMVQRAFGVAVATTLAGLSGATEYSIPMSNANAASLCNAASTVAIRVAAK